MSRLVPATLFLRDSWVQIPPPAPYIILHKAHDDQVPKIEEEMINQLLIVSTSI
jgi:hypothetical protein